MHHRLSPVFPCAAAQADDGRALLQAALELPELVSYPVYALPEEVDGWKLALAGFGDPETELIAPFIFHRLLTFPPGLRMLDNSSMNKNFVHHRRTNPCHHDLFRRQGAQDFAAVQRR